MTLKSGMWLAVLLLLLAFALRVFALEAVPPGIQHDEVSELDTAESLRAGEWRLLYAGGFGEDGSEGGYYPFLAAAQDIWGNNNFARRLPSVFANVMACALTYALATRLFDRRVGLIALGASAVVWWSILMGRVILREALELPVYAASLYAFWRGVTAVMQADSAGRARRAFVWAGVMLGLAQYIHTIPRGLFLTYVGFGLYLLIAQRAWFKRLWRSIVVTVIVAELIAAPLLITVSLNPDVDEVGANSLPPDSEESLGQRLVTNLPWVLGQFTFAGDDAWEFNQPYRPIFQPVAAILFLIGVVLAVARLRRPAYAFVLIALSVSLLPSILLKSNFTFARLVSAQPMVFALFALGTTGLGQALQPVTPARWRRPIGWGALAGLLIIMLITTTREMLIGWPADWQTRFTYNAELRELSTYLDTQIAPQSAPPPVSQCVLWIVYPWRPKYHLAVQQAVLPYLLTRADVAVRWHDCRYSLVIPDGGQFIFAHSDLEPLSDHLGRFLGDPWLIDKHAMPGVNGAYFVDARSALAAQQAVWRDLPVTWPPEATVSTPRQLPINFGNALDLIGYRFEPPHVKPGEAVAVITYWRVTGAVADDTVLFTHLYRTPAEVMAQQDQLDVGGSSLKVGDIFIQQHEFIMVPSDTQAGAYQIGLGLYHKETGERWPILIDGERVADRLFLDQVQVQP